MCNSSHFLSPLSYSIKLPAGNGEAYSVITSLPGDCPTGELLFTLHLHECSVRLLYRMENRFHAVNYIQ